MEDNVVFGFVIWFSRQHDIYIYTHNINKNLYKECRKQIFGQEEQHIIHTQLRNLIYKHKYGMCSFQKVFIISQGPSSTQHESKDTFGVYGCIKHNITHQTNSISLSSREKLYAELTLAFWMEHAKERRVKRREKKPKQKLYPFTFTQTQKRAKLYSSII
ncbi:unnamed protein product [Orchesella dallaii]|uniref:Uncharacterized protein n=1 Tax=Orchesella dallaii TaxID=48710 RepID=A0ABP1RRC3_9HEXA